VSGSTRILETQGTAACSHASGTGENPRCAGPAHPDRNAPSRESVCAVIVTHNPDASFLSRVERVRPQVAQVVIVDNGSAELALEEVRQLENQQHLHLILNQVNHGIAHALNQGAQWAANCGHRWILTLDQDTVVAPGMVDALAAVYHALPDRQRLAVIGSNYTHRENGKVAMKGECEAGAGAGEVKAVITSGSLIPLSALEEIGGFREEFFVDCVDVDYSLRARAHGFRVLRTLAPLMQHSVGNLTEHRWFGKPMATTNHSPWRRYLQVRNTVILAREYLGRDPALVLSALGSRAQAILRVCLFESQRFRKLAYSLLGVLDGLLGKMNRFG
jgi:rhamnosyltransferase